VWKRVGENQAKLNDNLKANVNAPASPTSFQLSLESPELVAKVAEYETALKAAGEDRNDIIGVVFAVNGNVTGAEVYGSNAIFRKAWPKLLNSAAVEALRERTDKPLAAAPSTREVERFLARAAGPEPTKADTSDPAVAAQSEMVRMTARVRDAERASAQRENFFLAGIDNVETIGPIVALPNPAPQPAPNPAGTPQPSVVVRAYALDPAPNPAPNPPGQPAQNPDRAGRIVIEGNERTGDRVILNPVRSVNPAGLQPGQPLAQPSANPNGNRLNTNVNVNPSSLMVESRDPARQNAIIHRSYLRR
jgi:hypothetical protein